MWNTDDVLELGEPIVFEDRHDHVDTLTAWLSQAWQEALAALDLDPTLPIPGVVRAKYRRAQRLYLLAWMDGDVLLAGEMIAFTALELALNDQIGPQVAALEAQKRKKPDKPIKAKVSATGQISTPTLAALLDHLVTHQGISEADFPTALIGGGKVVDRLRRPGPKASRPTLSEMRNRHAHGAPIEGGPLSGLLHVVRDLLHFLYRGPSPKGP
ncbi:MAG: hypothetical protein J7521_07710 [Caulobacter sp.]|nr:hypothetical protein [Caulobacter sp.]